ncbi:MAG: BREX-3 system phosphatase PglZ [Planctomycetota bacterium]|nr:BREX-3 system phosphatase PglZ [Planctomycetota bacterium]
MPYSKDYTINHVPPVMLHHVTRELTRQREESADKKVALVLVDGMAISQWLVVRDVLQAQRPGLHFQERAVFAWIPTITAVSRQAAFAAKPPLYFPESIYSTDEDAAQWELFWSDHGLTNWGSMYIRGLGERGLDKVTEMASHPSLRAFGLVVDKIDKIMHGMTLGMDGMLAQVRQWAEKGYLARLLGILLDRGFAVTVTSDHGNIEAVGCGNPSEGAIADIRGERVRVFSDECLLAGVQERFPDALPWLPVGLPEGYLPLLAPGRLAFVSEGDRIVAHGGMSLEEVVVPLIQVTRKAQ